MFNLIIGALGLNKTWALALLVTVILFILSGLYTCHEIKERRNKAALEKEVTRQEEVKQKKGQDDVELNENYLQDLEKKNSLIEEKETDPLKVQLNEIKNRIETEVKEKIKQDPAFKKLQEEAKKRHFKELGRILDKSLE